MASNVQIEIEVVVEGIKNVNKIKDRIQGAVQEVNKQMDKLGDGAADNIISKEAKERIEGLEQDVKNLRKELDKVGGGQGGKEIVDTQSVEEAEEGAKQLSRTSRQLKQQFENAFEQAQTGFDESERRARRINRLVGSGIEGDLGEMDIDQNVAKQIKEIEEDFNRLRKEANKVSEAISKNGDFSGELRQKYKRLKQEIRENVDFTKNLSQAYSKNARRVMKLDDDNAKLLNTANRLGRSMLNLEDKLETAGNSARKYGTMSENVIQTNGSLLRRNRQLSESFDRVNREMIKNIRVSQEAAESNDRVGREARQASTGMRQAAKGAQSYNDELTESVRKNFKFISAIGLVTSAIMGLQNAFMELLEQSRAFVRVQSVMSEEALRTAGNIEKVRDRIRQAVIETGERIDEVGETMFQLLSAGLSLQEGLAGLNSAMNVQIATAGDARDVTKSVAGVYNVFGDQMTETQSKQQALADIGDVLTGVYKNHQVEINEVTKGLEFASSAANIAGFSFEETASFLAVLNDNMIKGGRAGRGLQRVFTQFANKADKFKQAFGVSVDRSIPLSEQFVRVLESVNDRVDKGALNLEELRTRFQTFGLRGAPVFIQLAQNMDDVNEVIDNMRNNVDGLADSVAQMAQDSLFRSFQSAKQALLQLGAAAFEGPLIQGLHLISDAIVNIQEVLSNTGLDSFLGNTVVIVGSLVVSFQSLLAVSKLLVASFSSLFGVISLSTISSLASQFITAASATNTLTASVNALKLAWAFSPGGVVAASIAIIGSATAAIGFMNESVGELNDQIDRTKNKVSRLNREINSIKEFKDSFSEVNKEVRSFGTTSDAAAKKVKRLFEQSSLNLGVGQRVQNMSDSEIVKNLTGIGESTRVELKQKMQSIEEERRKQRQKIINKQRQQLSEQFDLEGVGHNFVESFTSMIGFEDVQTVSEANLETEFRNIFSEQRREFLKASENLDFESQVNASEKFVENFTEANVKKIRTIMNTQGVGLDKAKEIWEENILDTFQIEDDVSDFISESIERQLNEGIAQITIPDLSPLRDIRERIVSPLMAIQQNLDTPFGSGQLNDFVGQVNRLQESAEDIGAGTNISLGFSEDLGELNLPTDKLQNFVLQSISGASEKARSQLQQSLANAFPDQVVFGENVIRSFERIIDKNSKFNSELGKTSIQASEANKILSVLTNSASSNFEKLSKTVTSFFSKITKERVTEGRADILSNMIDKTINLQGRLTSLNDVIQKQNEIRQKTTRRTFLTELLEQDIEGQSKKLIGFARRLQEASSEGEEAEVKSIAEKFVGSNKAGKKALQRLQEILKLNRDITKSSKEFNATNKENINALEKQILKNEQLSQSFVDGRDTIANQADLLVQNIKHTKEELRAQEQLGRGILASAEGMEKLFSLREEVLKLIEETKNRQRELNDLRRETSIRLNNIESLGTDRLENQIKFTQAFEKSLRLADKRLAVQKDLNDAQGSRRQNLKETAISQTDKLISQFETLQEASEEIGKQRRELNRVDTERLDIINSISQASEDRLSNVREDISSIFSSLSERDRFSFISGLSESTGTQIFQAFKDTDELTEEVLKNLKDGEELASNFSGEVRKAVESYQQLVDKNKELKEDLRGVQNRRINILRSQIESLIESGQLGRAQELLSDLRSAGSERFGGDPSKIIDFRKRVLELQKRISNAQEKRKREGLFDVAEVNTVQDKVAKIRGMIKQISIIDAFDFSGNVEKLESKLNNLKSKFSKIEEVTDTGTQGSGQASDESSEAGELMSQIRGSSLFQSSKGIFGEVETLFTDILVDYKKKHKQANSDLAQNIQEKQTEAAKKADVVENLAESLSDQRVSQAFVQTFKSSFVKASSVFNNIFSSIASNLPDDIREQNAEAIREFNSQISEINTNYSNTISNSESALEQNETGYMDFVDQVRNANQKRFQEELKAQKKLRDSIKDRQKAIEEAGVEAIKSAFKGSVDSNLLKNAIFQTGEDDFGLLDPLSKNVKQFGQSVGIGEGNQFSGFGNALQSGGSALLSGVASAGISMAPTIAGLADPETAQRASEVINSLGENDAQAITNFFDRIKSGLEKIGNALDNNAQAIISEFVSGIVTTFKKIFGVLIRNLPEILMGVVEGFFEGLFSGGGGSLSSALGMGGAGAGLALALGAGPIGAAIGGGIGLLSGAFHEGGVVPGSGEVPILAQSGEGVLSREGMRAIGGRQTLTQLNNGANMEDIFGRFNQASRPVPDQNITQNNSINISSDGDFRDREQQDRFIGEIERTIDKRLKDNKSNLDSLT